MRVIILAGGKATRMPNKLLMPSAEHGRTVLDGVIEAGVMMTGQSPVVVLGDDDAVWLYLKHRYGDEIDFVRQEGEGVCNAIATGAKLYGPSRDKAVVLFGDNAYAYPMRESQMVHECPAGGSYGSVRLVPFDRAQELDYWDGEWKARNKMEDPAPSHRQALAGWLVAPVGVFAEFTSSLSLSLIDHLNAKRFAAFPAPTDGWYDVGTKESYVSYLREETCQ